MPLLFAVFAAALLTGLVAIGVGWMCTLATGVSFSMLTLAFAQLLYAISFKWTSVTGGSDGLAGFRARQVPWASPRSPDRLLLFRSSPAWSAPIFLCFALVNSPFGAVLRGIRENEAKTIALGYNTRLYKIAVVSRLLRAGRARWRALSPVRGLRQYRAAVLAAVGTGADHGDRRWLRYADRPDPRRRVLHAHGAPAQLLDRGLGPVLRPDLHRLRPVRPQGIWTGRPATSASS